MTDTPKPRPVNDATPDAPESKGVRGTASKALDSTRERVTRTAESAGENPLALLAGGIALGVLVGVLLPRHPRERELLEPIGKRLAEGATAAALAAKEAGKAEIDQLLPEPEAARDRASKLVSNVVDAAKDAVKA